MDDQIVAIDCLYDDALKALDHADDTQRQMSDAEAMTTAIVAALHFHGHWQRAQDYLGTDGYKSQPCSAKAASTVVYTPLVKYSSPSSR